MRSTHYNQDAPSCIPKAASGSAPSDVLALALRLIRVVRATLIRAIDIRLDLLAQTIIHDHCPLCLFSPPQIQIRDGDDCCGYCWAGIPIYNGYFRTELEALLTWLAKESIIEDLAHEQGREYQPRPFSGDRPASLPSRPLTGALADIKRRDILEVASQYTELRPSGPGRHKGLCPLHQERTPSFYVYSESQRWHCFGACAGGGDVIELLKRLGKLQVRQHNPHRPRKVTNWEVRG